MGARRGGGARTSAKRQDGVVFAAGPSLWFRPDSVTPSGANVATLNSKVGTAKQTVTGTLPLAAVNAAFNDKLTLTTTGTQWADGDQAAAFYKFMADGIAGCTWFFVYKSNQNTSLQMLHGTTSALASGYDQYIATDQSATCRMPANTVSAAAATLGTATYLVGTNKTGGTPALSLGRKGAAASTSALAAVTTGPEFPLRLFAQPSTNGFPSSIDFADFIVFPYQMTAAQQLSIETAYIQARYGIAP